MSRFMVILLIIVCTSPTNIRAECRIVNYVDHDEVECTDNNQKFQPKTTNNESTSRAKELESIIKANENEIETLKIRIKSEKDKTVISNLFYELHIKIKEMLENEIEWGELTIKNTVKLDEFKQKIRGLLKNNDSLLQQEINENEDATRKQRVKVTSISALQTSVGYSYGYYSVKADFDNYDNSPHSVSALIQALGFDGHVIESVRLSAKLDKRQSKTVATETMIELSKVPRITRWEATDVDIK